jgi:hypothetical protein
VQAWLQLMKLYVSEAWPFCINTAVTLFEVQSMLGVLYKFNVFDLKFETCNCV